MKKEYAQYSDAWEEIRLKRPDGSGIFRIFGFPVRSEKPIINNIFKGGAAYERNTEFPTSVGKTGVNSKVRRTHHPMGTACQSWS